MGRICSYCVRTRARLTGSSCTPPAAACSPPTRALAERPLAVLCTRRPYHQLTVLWRGDIIATIAYTAIAYDTPAMGMVTVTTLFGTTITYPRERILGIV